MISEKMIWLEPVQNMVQVAELNAAVGSDPPHTVAWYPTHLCRKGGEITGYVSAGGTPLLHYWSHSKKHRASDSLLLANMAENLMSLQGHKGIIVPCSKVSPLYALMPSLGYTPVAETVLFAKKL